MKKSDILRGGHCIHEPIQSDTDPKYETGVVWMDTNSNIYIQYAHFSSLSHSPTVTLRHGKYPTDYGRK